MTSRKASGLCMGMLLARARRRCTMTRFGAVLLCGLAHSLTALAAVGDIDPSYGTEGRYALSLPQYRQSEPQSFVRADGRVSTIVVEAEQLHFFRADINGRPDLAIGVGGERTIPVPGMRYGYWSALGPGGSMFIALDSLTGSSHRLLRLTPDGNVDGSFGHAGMISLDSVFDRPGTTQYIQSITPLRDGGAVLMFADFPNGPYDCGYRLRLLRIRQDGQLSPAFVLESGHFSLWNCYEWGSWSLIQELPGSRLQVVLYDTNLLFDISGPAGLQMVPASWPSGFNPGVIVAADERYNYAIEPTVPLGTVRVVRLVARPAEVRTKVVAGPRACPTARRAAGPHPAPDRPPARIRMQSGGFAYFPWPELCGRGVTGPANSANLWAACRRSLASLCARDLHWQVRGVWADR